MMKVVWLLVKLLLLLVLTGALLLASLLEQESSVGMVEIQPDDQTFYRVKRLLRAPKTPQGMHLLVLNNDEANLALQYLLREQPRLAMKAHIGKNALQLITSYEVPSNPLGRYFNFQWQLEPLMNRPVLRSAQIGRYSLPEGMVELLQRLGEWYLDQNPQWQLIQKFKIQGKNLVIHAKWNDRAKRELKKQLLGADLQLQLERHQWALQRVVDRHQGMTLEVSALFQSVLDEVSAHASSGEAKKANTALLLVATAYMKGRSLDDLLERKIPLPNHRPRLTLHGREDLAKHFLISASISSLGHTDFSRAMGLHKELRDAEVGSGFSFADLAADLAGDRFAKRSSESETLAAKMRAQMRSGINDADLIPQVDDLPESLSQFEFMRRFGNTRSAAYRELLAQIEARISLCKLYQ